MKPAKVGSRMLGKSPMGTKALPRAGKDQGMDSVYANPKLAPIVARAKIATKNAKPLPNMKPKSAIKKRSQMTKNPSYAQVSKSVQKAKGY